MRLIAGSHKGCVRIVCPWCRVGVYACARAATSFVVIRLIPFSLFYGLRHHFRCLSFDFVSALFGRGGAVVQFVGLPQCTVVQRNQRYLTTLRVGFPHHFASMCGLTPHQRPWLMPRTFLKQEAKWFPEGALAELPDYESDLLSDPTAHAVRAWELEPGDAIAFHMLTVHVLLFSFDDIAFHMLTVHVLLFSFDAIAFHMLTVHVLLFSAHLFVWRYYIRCAVAGVESTQTFK
jgi:hypothetical protein